MVWQRVTEVTQQLRSNWKCANEYHVPPCKFHTRLNYSHTKIKLLNCLFGPRLRDFVAQWCRWGHGTTLKTSPGQSTASSLCRWSRSCGAVASLQLQPGRHWNWCERAEKTWSTGTAPLGQTIWTKLRNLPGGTRARKTHTFNSGPLEIHLNLVILKAKARSSCDRKAAQNKPTLKQSVSQHPPRVCVGLRQLWPQFYMKKISRSQMPI